MLIRIINNHRRLCCDNCRRPVGMLIGLGGRVDELTMNPRAGYVLGVGKRTGIIACGPRGCNSDIEHPLACSDACEDRLLKTWSRTDTDDVNTNDWGEDFRDKGLEGKR